MELDDQVRYKLFRNTEGRCAHCHTRLHWEEFDVRGRSGGWVLEVSQSEEGEVDGRPFCFRCHDLPNRRKTGRLYTRAGFAGGVAKEDEEQPSQTPDAAVEEN